MLEQFLLGLKLLPGGVVKDESEIFLLGEEKVDETTALA